MENKYNQKLTSLAKQLRKSMTKEERHLWYDFLRDYPIRFYRQKVLGRYIVDFYCAKAHLVLELDGSQHFEPAGVRYDEERTKYLQQFQLDVLRIPNNAVMDNFSGVCQWIDNEVRKRIPIPDAGGIAK